MQNENSIDIKSIPTKSFLPKILPIIFYVFLPLIGFFIGIRYQLIKDSSTFNTLMKEANKDKEVVYVNQNNSQESKPREGILQTYTSQNLGVSIKYFQDKNAKTPVKVKEIGNRIYLYVNNSVSEPDNPTSGQFIEVFNKTPGITLDAAISEKFLAGYPEDCQVAPTDLTKNYLIYSPDFEYKYINVANMNPNDSFAENEKKAEQCPKDYTYYRSKRYFVMDKNHPDRFAFVSLGQQGGFASYPGLSWDMTFTFND